MARYPGTLESANTNEFGIVFADHIQGHRTVANLEALYKLSDAILSKSKNNTGNDAIGQEWYVISEKSVYRLDDWANRKQASGWRKLQNVDTEFDSLQSHGADKIKNFTTTANDVTLNYNTWKNSETSEDGTAVIPAASLTRAGMLAADQRNQLEQLNKLGVISKINDFDDETTPTFTTTESTVTLNYKNISSTAGANSSVVTKTANIPVVTKSTAGIMTSTDKINLDETLPNAIEAEAEARQQAIEDLEDRINNDISVKLTKEIEDRKAGDNNLIEQLGFEGEAGSSTYSPINTDIQGKNVTEAIDFLADEKYRSEMPDDLQVPNSIGGLKAGQTASDLRKKSISQILDDILFPELNPTITAPSASISFKSGFSNNQILEVNATAPVNPTNFTTGFNQGLSKVAGQPDKKRAGALNSEGSFIYYGTADQKVLPTKVVLGTMTYKYRAAYAQGEICVTSKGNKASSVNPNPLPSGTVDSGAIQIYGTYPYFCNGQSASSSSQDNNLPTSVTDNTKLPLQKWSDTIVGAKFASEASTEIRIVFEFPSTKKVTKVEFMNTVSGKWENFPNYSTSSSDNKTIQGLQVSYSKLTTTGALSGAIQLRFTVANV